MQSFAQTFIWVMMAVPRDPVLLPLKALMMRGPLLRSSMAMIGKVVCLKSARTALLVLPVEDTVAVVSVVASAVAEASVLEAALDVEVSEVDMGAVGVTVVAAIAALLLPLGTLVAAPLLPRLRQTRSLTMLHPVVSVVRPFMSVT